jgi:hypothetical protein
LGETTERIEFLHTSHGPVTLRDPKGAMFSRRTIRTFMYQDGMMVNGDVQVFIILTGQKIPHQDMSLTRLVLEDYFPPGDLIG